MKETAIQNLAKYPWFKLNNAFFTCNYVIMLTSGSALCPVLSYSTLFQSMTARVISELYYNVVYFTRLRCTYTPCLCTWLHLRFSYCIKILPVVVSIVFCYQKYIICDKVKSFPELTDILLRERCETLGGYKHKHKLEGAMYNSSLSFRKNIPRTMNSPLD